MDKNNSTAFSIETKLEMISLKLQASRIRNSEKLQESLNSLMNFVGYTKKASC